ncbi:uncharacterized protein LOC129605210 [Condylostylus longicornis]|uniref:uncharacterized protein LOC129605210 n=1 Tax=Condylostylus longicornis TaxID=2530218 RepID=UPI00244DE21E|nr:uncharacterized protein LOC129605210 [Condylostylus longicornis]
MSKTRKVAPDGGWGWMACFGVSLVNLATRSLEPSFGLLFGDLLRDLEVGTTGAAVIISALDVCMNFSGLLVGPLLKEFSYRKVAVAGSLFCWIGLACTTPANSMAHILATFSVINGIGVGLSTSAAFVALNHYFKHKRGQAVGLSMAGTALGMLVIPQFVRILLDAYGFRGAVLIISSISFHALVGSMLLQPVKWHMKEEVIDVELMPVPEIIEPEPLLSEKPKKEQEDQQNGHEKDNKQEQQKENELNGNNIPANGNGKLLTVGNGNEDEEDALPELNTLLFNKHNNMQNNMRKNYSEVAMSTMFNGTRMGIPKRPTFPRIMSLGGVQSAAGADALSNPDVTQQIRNRKLSVTSNLSLLDFGGSIVQVHINTGDDELEKYEKEFRRVSTQLGIPFGTGMSKADSFIKMKPIETEKLPEIIPQPKPGFWRRFADLMDIDLLRDKIFLNLLFGLSIFYVAEMNFKMVTPFFFANLGYDKGDVAFCLSITAVTDILARIILPPLFDKTTIRKRTVFLVSIVFVAITRSIVAEQTEWTPLIIWLSIAGFFRGIALSNFTLTVSEYCSLEKLPSAFGWHLVGKAIFVVCFGPLIGAIRDITNSFPICIHVQSCCIYTCAIAWSIEYSIQYFRSKGKAKDQEVMVST